MKKTILAVALGIAGCSQASTSTPGPASGPTADTLAQRAYIVSRDSDEVTVIDLRTLEITGTMRTGGVRNHMVELNANRTKGFVDSPGTNETVVLDLEKLVVKNRVPLGAEPTHLSLNKDGKLLAIVNEYGNSVNFVDPEREVVVKVLDGFFTPHFVRFAPDGRYAYVANIGAHHVTRVDLQTLSIDGHIVLDGFAGPPYPTLAPEESGFADVQIDANGILYGAHAATGQVLVYDTRTQKKLAEVRVGAKPWIVYAEHPFDAVIARVVPNFGDQTVSVLRPESAFLANVIGGADSQSFGVNYSSLAPHKAFVMNRVRQEIAVVDTVKQTNIDTIAVGGNTETASTTADGKWIVAAVSSANRVVVIDALTHAIVKTFDNLGRYPWSVTIPGGQNYCH